MVPKSPPPSATSETQTPQTLVLERWGSAPATSWLASVLQRLPVDPGLPGTQTLTEQSLASLFVWTLNTLLPNSREGSLRPPGHSTSSSRPAGTKTRRRGTCALGTGAMLAAKLGMLSRLSRSGRLGGESELGRPCSVGMEGAGGGGDGPGS